MSEHFHYIEDMSLTGLNLGENETSCKSLQEGSEGNSKPRESKIWKVLDAFGGQMEIDVKMLKLWGVDHE